MPMREAVKQLPIKGLCWHCDIRLQRHIYFRSTRRRSLTTTATSSPRSMPLPQPRPAQQGDPSQTLLTPEPLTLHAYRSSIPPSGQQLRHANRFFDRSNAAQSTAGPALLWSTPHFRSIPTSPYPEVCFLGRSNVGKSSLLNALLGRPRARPARVSKRPGRTRTMNGFAVGPGATDVGVRRVDGQRTGGRVSGTWMKGGGEGGKGGTIVVVDMPGYGAASRDEWGEEIVKYLERRAQLRRAFVLVDAEHGLKDSDVVLLRHLAERGVAHQLLLSKVDRLLGVRSRVLSPARMDKGLGRLRERIEEVQGRLLFDATAPGPVADVISCSGEKTLAEYGLGRERIGIAAVRWAMLSACGMGCDEDGHVREGGFDDKVHALEAYD